MLFNIPFMSVSVLCVSFIFCEFCVLFLLLYTANSFLFLYKSTDHCHRVETQIAVNKYSTPALNNNYM